MNQPSSFGNVFRPLVLVTCVAVSTALAFAAVDFPPGTYAIEEYKIVFGEKGQFRVSKGADVMVEGEYKVKGNELRLTDKRGPMACKEAGQETGSGPRRGKQFTYTLLDERAPRVKPLERDEALAELAGRYFVSRGPATLRDFAKWSGLTLADARDGIGAVNGRLQREDVGGQSYWFSTSAPSAKDAPPAAHLLSIYDEYISGYRDRGAIVEARHAAKLSALGNALNCIVVVDGRVAGTWKRTLRGGAVVIETNSFTRLTRTEERAVAAAARQYGEFLDLPVVLA